MSAELIEKVVAVAAIKCGLSQKEVAARVGVSESCVSRWCAKRDFQYLAACFRGAATIGMVSVPPYLSEIMRGEHS